MTMSFSESGESGSPRRDKTSVDFSPSPSLRPSRRQSGALLLSLLFSSLPASALTVTTIADELDTPAGPEISLREAIRDTSSGDTVDFAASLSGQTIELTMGSITTLYTTLTIDASSLPLGITISGGGNSRIFEPSITTLNLLDLTLTKGSAASGGAIYNRTSSTVTMTRCRLFDNEATQEGGAIYCAVSDLILNDCWLGHNRAGTRGGAIYLLGVQCDLSLVNSTLTHNTAHLDGGGISAHTINSVSLQGSTLSHNDVSAGPGGGVCALDTSITLENSTIVGNTAAAAGGGLHSDRSFDMSSCTITGNSSDLAGGGVFLLGPAISLIRNTIVAGNTAADAADIGGDDATFNPSGVNFIGTNNGCETDFPAGSPNANADLVGTDAAPLDPQLGPLAICGGDTETRHPLADSPVINAGGVSALATDQRGFGRTVGAAADIGAVETGAALLVTTSIDENSGVLGQGAGDSLRECFAAAAGTGDFVTFAPGLDGTTIQLGFGSINMNAESVVVDASSLPGGITVHANWESQHFYLMNQSTLVLHSVNLRAGSAPGGDYAYGGAIRAEHGNVTLIGSQVSECTAAGTTISHGGAISLTNPNLPSVVTLIDCDFVRNTASGASLFNRGGAINLNFGSARLLRCSFHDNEVYGGTTATNSCGALWVGSGFLFMEDCSFENNLASAGSVAIGGALETGSITLLDRCTFRSNSATATAPAGECRGGAVNLTGDGPFFLRNATFTGNTASDDGGAIASSGGFVLEHGTVSGNSATGGSGGGIRLDQGTALLKNSLIAGNSAGTAAADVSKQGASTNLVDDGGNLIGDNDSISAEFPVGPLVGDTANPLDPELGVLGNWGGSTKTLLLKATSPAIDMAVASPGSPPTDQRGYARSVGAGPDIGAYEAGNRAGYPVWAAEEIPTGWDATFDGNSEGDAWQNGIEYACRRNPRVDDGASVLHIELMPSGDGGSEVHLSFPYEPDAPDLFYFIRRNGDLVSPLASRYRYNSATGGQLYHPSGNVTSALDPAGKTITVIDAGIGVGPHFWRLEVEEIP